MRRYREQQMGLRFEALIVRNLVPSLWKGACMVLDNYSIHKGKQVEKAIQIDFLKNLPP